MSLKIILAVAGVILLALVAFLLVKRVTSFEVVRGSDGSSEIRVNVGGDLQGAIDASKLGDTIVLQPGATFTGPFTLPDKGPGKGTDADYITIRIADLSLISPDGERINPKVHGGDLPKIVAPAQQTAIRTAARAHHYRFVGIEFSPAAKASYLYNLIDLGESNYRSQSEFPHHLIFDRCYVHSGGLNKARRGFALNSMETSVINSHVSGFAGDGDETQAIAGWNGPGPFHIINNYLEAGAEVILFGGADPSIPNLVPSDIEIRRNYLYRPPEWAGKVTMKGSFELKNARRVVVDGNVIESTNPRQVAFVITVRNQDTKAPWSTIEDVEITNNISKHASSGVNILGRDNQAPSQQAKRIKVANNLFTDLTLPGETSYFLQVSGTDGLSVEHNTVQNIGNIISAYGQQTVNFVFRDNIVQYNAYGVACFIENVNCPGLAYCRCFPDVTMKGNVVADNANVSAQYPIDKAFPAGNFIIATYDGAGFVDFAHDKWQLKTASPFHGKASDGKDPGIDFAAFEASGVRSAITGSRK
jgi:hypothetical protein